MPDVLPISLIVAWTVMATAVYLQREHMNHVRVDYMNDRTILYYFAVAGSVILAGIVSLVLLYLYFSVAGLLWTAVLFVTMTIVGGIVAAPLSAFVSHQITGRLGFVAWPAAAAATYVLIDGLPK